MTFDEFLTKYESKKWGYPNNANYLGQCLSLTKWHIKEVYGIEPPASGCNAARCYWSVFPNPLGTVLKKVTYVAGMVPKKGWIPVWSGAAGDGYGHIASIISASTTSFVSLDQNWGGMYAHRVTHNYNNLYGFLVPINEEDDMADCTAERESRDHYWNILKEISISLDKEIKEEKDVDVLPSLVEDLIGDVVNLTDEIEDHVCPECPIIPPSEPSDELKLKERTEEYVKDEVKIIKKYAI